MDSKPKEHVSFFVTERLHHELDELVGQSLGRTLRPLSIDMKCVLHNKPRTGVHALNHECV